MQQVLDDLWNMMEMSDVLLRIFQSNQGNEEQINNIKEIQSLLDNIIQSLNKGDTNEA